jgi:MFS family permease
MQQVLDITDSKEILVSFSLICVTAPTFGLMMGGLACSLIGGYESKHSILLCVLFTSCAIPFSILVPMANTSLSFAVFLWMVLFFGAAIFPALTGIILSSLPPHLRGLGNSINCFVSNLFGFIPSPYIYGLINYLYQDVDKKMAFRVIMCYPIICLVLISIATIFRYRKFENIEVNKNENADTSVCDKIEQPHRKEIELFDVASKDSSDEKTSDEELNSNFGRRDSIKPLSMV